MDPREQDHARLAQAKAESNGFTTKDLVLLLREDIKEMRADYEPRIRSLERWKAAVPGVGFVAAVVTVASFFIGH